MQGADANKHAGGQESALEEVIIASNSIPMVKLVPLGKAHKLGGWGRPRKFAGAVDSAFTPKVDAEIARMFKGEA